MQAGFNAKTQRRKGAKSLSRPESGPDGPCSVIRTSGFIPLSVRPACSASLRLAPWNRNCRRCGRCRGPYSTGRAPLRLSGIRILTAEGNSLRSRAGPIFPGAAERVVRGGDELRAGKFVGRINSCCYRAAIARRLARSVLAEKPTQPQNQRTWPFTMPAPLTIPG